MNINNTLSALMTKCGLGRIEGDLPLPDSQVLMGGG